MIPPEIVVAGAGMIASIVVWGFRQEGRINALQLRIEQHEELGRERHVEVLGRLDRIERLLMGDGR